LATEVASRPLRSHGVERRRAARSRGAAFAEAVIMLPVFTIIFFGVMYVKQSTIVSMQNLSKVRHCAWVYSKAACDMDAARSMKGDPLDPECEKFEMGKDCGDRPNDPSCQRDMNAPDTLFRTDKGSAPATGGATDTAQNSGMGDKITDMEKAQQGGKSSKKAGGFKGVLMDALKGLVSAFGNEKFDMKVQKQLQQGKVLGNRRVTIATGYKMSCNTKPRTLWQLLGDLLSPLSPF
jgi:hypothetical protein